MIEGLKHRYWDWNRRREHRRIREEGLAALREASHPLAVTLAESVENAARRKHIRHEHHQIQKIERQRDSLSRSTDSIEHIDFGAGEPDSPRDELEARKGVPVTILISRLATVSSKYRPWSNLIYNLVRNLQPQKCLELGTCIGFSAAYQCAAMSVTGHGKLISLEGDPKFAQFARSNLSSLGYSNFDIVVGRFEDTLDLTLRNEQPIDFIFNDGHHDGKAMLDYFNRILPYFADGSVMLFDDIGNYESMRRGWESLIRHPKVDLSINLGEMGIICVNKNSNQNLKFTIPLI